MQLRFRIFSAAVLTATPAFADTATSASASANSVTRQSSAVVVVPHPPLMPVADATAIALRRVPGVVLAVETETDNGIRLYQVDIARKAGGKARLFLNAHTGEILAIR